MRERMHVLTVGAVVAASFSFATIPATLATSMATVIGTPIVNGAIVYSVGKTFGGAAVDAAVGCVKGR